MLSVRFAILNKLAGIFFPNASFDPQQNLLVRAKRESTPLTTIKRGPTPTNVPVLSPKPVQTASPSTPPRRRAGWAAD